MNLQHVTVPSMAHLGGLRTQTVNDFAIRRLKTSLEIEDILYLREEIDLSVHEAAGAAFSALEKKETNAALSAHSNCRGKSSGRSEWCQWDLA